MPLKENLKSKHQDIEFGSILTSKQARTNYLSM